MAVVKEIAESRATRWDQCGQATARGGRNLTKPGAIEITKQLRTLGPSRTPVPPVCIHINMSAGDENVEQSVIVEVEKAVPPGEEWNGRLA